MNTTEQLPQALPFELAHAEIIPRMGTPSSVLFEGVRTLRTPHYGVGKDAMGRAFIRTTEGPIYPPIGVVVERDHDTHDGKVLPEYVSSDGTLKYLDPMGTRDYPDEVAFREALRADTRDARMAARDAKPAPVVTRMVRTARGFVPDYGRTEFTVGDMLELSAQLRNEDLAAQGQPAPERRKRTLAARVAAGALAVARAVVAPLAPRQQTGRHSTRTANLRPVAAATGAATPGKHHYGARPNQTRPNLGWAA